MESGEEQELSLATFESDILNISIAESLKEFDNLDLSALTGSTKRLAATGASHPGNKK